MKIKLCIGLPVFYYWKKSKLKKLNRIRNNTVTVNFLTERVKKMCGISYPARWIFHLWRVLDGLLRVLILLIILNVIRLFFVLFLFSVVSVCYYAYIHIYHGQLLVHCSYYALLYLLITCSPHYTIGANKWWWWWCGWWWWWWWLLLGYIHGTFADSMTACRCRSEAVYTRYTRRLSSACHL